MCKVYSSSSKMVNVFAMRFASNSLRESYNHSLCEFPPLQRTLFVSKPSRHQTILYIYKKVFDPEKSLLLYSPLNNLKSWQTVVWKRNDCHVFWNGQLLGPLFVPRLVITHYHPASSLNAISKLFESFNKYITINKHLREKRLHCYCEC